MVAVQHPHLLHALTGPSLPPLQLVVGSDPRPGSNIDVLVAVTTVSRNHARLILDGGQVLVVDLGSTNGTFVEGKRLMKGERVPLAVGQSVCFCEESGISYILTEAILEKAAQTASAMGAGSASSEAERGARSSAAPCLRHRGR